MLLFAIAFAFTSCKKEPTACFATDKSTAAVNSPIVCDASCSKEAGKYMWFAVTGGSLSGNASSSTETYTFSSPGTYTIKLEVTNGKKSNIITHDVTIN